MPEHLSFLSEQPIRRVLPSSQVDTIFRFPLDCFETESSRLITQQRANSALISAADGRLGGSCGSKAETSQVSIHGPGHWLCIASSVTLRKRGEPACLLPASCLPPACLLPTSCLPPQGALPLPLGTDLHRGPASPPLLDAFEKVRRS
jgi:hypothetical protein